MKAVSGVVGRQRVWIVTESRSMVDGEREMSPWACGAELVEVKRYPESGGR